MNRLSCFLFDLDGTLLDSREPIVDAMLATVQQYLPGRFTRNDLLERFANFQQFLEPMFISQSSAG